MTEPLGIVELVGVCADMRARSLALFTQLGASVTTTAEPALQRVFAEACHRHAWHAELWERRTPIIPVSAGDDAVAFETAWDLGDDERRTRYASELADLQAAVSAIGDRVDPALDPSTTRTTSLVLRDLAELQARLAR